MTLAKGSGQDGQAAMLARHIAAGEWRGAHGIALDLLGADAGDDRAFAALATIAEVHGNIGKAAELLARALARRPDDARYLIRQAKLFLLLSRTEDARSAALLAARQTMPDMGSADDLGVVLARVEEHQEAARIFRIATQGDGARAATWRNLGNVLQFLGALEQANDAYEQALLLDPDDSRSWFALIHLRRQGEADEPRLTALLALWEARDQDADDALRIGHSIAKLHEDRGRHDAMMAWLHRAKAAKKTLVRHDPDATDALYALAAQAPRPAPSTRAPERQASPIFVTGLPRSGTTLVDRIVGAHPGMVSVGESPAFSLAVKRLGGSGTDRVLDAATLQAAGRIDPDRLASLYLETLSARAGDKRTVDKMPLNILYAGLIHSAFPDARIICLRRHPLDVILANYRQMFSAEFGYYDHGYDLPHIARWYVAFDRLVTHWSATLPAGRFLQIDYEALVDDQMGATRRLLDACGLGWDDACLNFHKSGAAVSTASSVQVREPIHNRSVGAWRRHTDALAPAMAELDRAGIAW